MSTTEWPQDWSKMRACVLGLGVTGFAAVDTLVELGVQVRAIGAKVSDDHAELMDVLGVDVVVATSPEAEAASVVEFAPDLVIVSPGYAPHHPAVRAVLEAGIPLWSEVDLAWRLRAWRTKAAKWLCVTGTNGKTTTVELTASMLQAQGLRAVACGNIGVPVLDAVRNPDGFDVLVVELSSFQLHYTHLLRPWASVCLNIADDHLDWHGSAEAYRAAKAKVYAHTESACIYNRDDAATKTFVEQADVQDGARAIGFGLSVPGPSDFGVVDGVLADRAFLAERQSKAIELTTRAALSDLGLGADHLVADVLAAAALSRSLGVTPVAIRSALSGFHPDGHRIETVCTRRGVTWIDDSKATNPHAARASLHAFDHIVWVVGGLLKGVDINPLVADAAPRLRAAIVIGADRAPVLDAFVRHAPNVPVEAIEAHETGQVISQAVAAAARVAQPGDVVLLAPAAASWDQFDSYMQRGDMFAAAARALTEGDGHDDDSSSNSAE